MTEQIKSTIKPISDKSHDRPGKLLRVERKFTSKRSARTMVKDLLNIHYRVG